MFFPEDCHLPKQITMQKKKPFRPAKEPEVLPNEYPEFIPFTDPEDPFRHEEDPDIIPEEDPYVTPPEEIPPPGEKP